MNQKKAKFNVVDIIVILILIAGIAFVAVRMFGGAVLAIRRRQVLQISQHFIRA